MIGRMLPITCLALLCACTAAQIATVSTTASTVIADGQLICRVGPTFLAMVSPSGTALLAKGATAAAVAATCAAVNGVATALPAMIAAIPTTVTPPIALPTAAAAT